MITSYCIYIFNVIVLCYVIKNLLIRFAEKPDNYLSYKVINKALSMLSIILYIVIFYIILNYQRILYRDRVVDLNLYVTTIKDNVILSDISWSLKMIFLLTSILLIIVICLSICYLHKILSTEIYKFYLYMNYRAFLYDGANHLNNRYNTQAQKDNRSYYPSNHRITLNINKLFNFLRGISNRTLLLYIIETFLEDLFLFLQDMNKIQNETYIQHMPISNPAYRRAYLLLKKNLFNKRGHIRLCDAIFRVSPIALIAYECLCNNFVLHYIFIYMIFYVPVIILHRITKSLGHADCNTNDLIWTMCYKQENCMYLATNDQCITFMYFIRNGLKLPLELDGDLNRVFLSETLNLLHVSPLRYHLTDVKHGIYTNAFCDTAQKKGDGKYYVVKDYDFEGGEAFIEYGEELAVLLDKTGEEAVAIKQNI